MGHQTNRSTRWLVCVMFWACSVAAESSQAEELERVTGSKIKNVLFIISDDLKASVLGCYGDKFCQTPNIDRLAKSGMVFQRAYCQATWCAPSRQSFMHSRYQSGGKTNLGMHLQSNGVHTARVGKIYHMRVPGDIIAGTNGTDIASTWTERYNSAGQEAHTPGDYACLNLNIFTKELRGRQSTKMPHRPFVTVEYDGDGSDQADYKSADKAIEILRERADSEQPFMLAVGMVRPHYPMVAPRKYFDLYDWKTIPLPELKPNDHDDIPKAGLGKSSNDKVGLSKYPENQKRMWEGYYASVSFMDDQVGRILDELDRLGLADTTAIIFTSDHGYHLGEHEWWQKSNMHEEVARVPLIVSAPGFQPGETHSLAELVDIFPTVSDLFDFEIPASVQGKSLLPILNDPATHIRQQALTIHNGAAIRGQQYTYIWYQDGTEELYDNRSDPKQFNNLIGSEYHLKAIQENRESLKSRLQVHDILFGKALKAKNNKKKKSP